MSVLFENESFFVYCPVLQMFTVRKIHFSVITFPTSLENSCIRFLDHMRAVVPHAKVACLPLSEQMAHLLDFIGCIFSFIETQGSFAFAGRMREDSKIFIP